MTTATCHTDDCGNADIPLDVGDLSAPDPFGDPWVEPNVVCGVCGQQITDLEPTPTNPDPEPTPTNPDPEVDQ